MRPRPDSLTWKNQNARDDTGARHRVTWTRRHVAALIVLCLAALLDTIDVTVVNAAMPAIKDALHFTGSSHRASCPAHHQRSYRPDRKAHQPAPPQTPPADGKHYAVQRATPTSFTPINCPHPQCPPAAADQGDTMHPVMLQQLIAEHVKELIAAADDARRVRQARRAQRSRAFRHSTRPSRPRTLAEPGRASASTAAVPAASSPGLPAGNDQRQPDELAPH
jgi:hypothetical protein